MTENATPSQIEIPKNTLTRWQNIADIMAELVGVFAALIMRLVEPRSSSMNTGHGHCTVAVALAAALFLLACARPAPVAPNPAPVDGFRVVNAYPHDPAAYTQGLIYSDGFLFESTGLRGRSTLRRVELETGRVLQRHALDEAYFAEGLTIWEDRLVQLTWQSNVAFVYDRASFEMKKTFAYPGEGWGLTSDRQGLILSDGTETLRFIEAGTFRETGRLVVTDGRVPVKGLNELEYVRGEVYANVRHTDRIARISPQSGRVTGWIDLKGLISADYRLEPAAELNGIAYDPVNDRLFVTGKLWPRLFEIEIVPR